MINKDNVSELFLRFSIAALFFYFGFDAVTNPEITAGQWMRPEIYNIISSILSIKIFMLTFGVVQILISAAILFGIYLRISLIAAAILLIGIIINLGFNDIAIRDFVILTSVIYLGSKKYGTAFSLQASNKQY